MRFDYHYYTVEIKNLKFTTEEGLEIPKTAIITLYDEQGGKLAVELLGYRETGEWFGMIAAGEPLNMNQCYVRDFSLTAYRESRGLEKKTYVTIPALTARNAFFDARVETDFSFAMFEDGNVDLEFTHFASGSVTFNSSRFGDGNPVFNNMLFRDGNVDFGNVVFGAGIKGFKNSVFLDGKKDFQYCNFGNGEVSFNNTEFHGGELSFINADFGEGNVSFKICRITGGRMVFHYARFGKGNISFERVEFGDSRVDFRAVEFGEGRVNFNRSLFGNGELTFEGSELPRGRFYFKRVVMGKGSVSFELAGFQDTELFFEKTDFGQRDVSFMGGNFHHLSLQSCHLDHYFDLRVAACDYLDLSDTVVRDIVDLQPYDQDVKIRVCNIFGMRLLGRLYLSWEENGVSRLITRQEAGYRMKSEQFRILKENFSVTGQYADEDKAYVFFKRYEALADLQKQKKKGFLSALNGMIQYGFKWLVFDKMGLYATDPVRVLISMVFAYLFFTAVYLVLPLFVDTRIVSSLGDPDKLSAFAVAFYHSAITFLTIGYGDYYPSGLIRWISGIEGFVGLFMMSYFTVAFVRKILR
jgi:hypothetical protein